LCPQAASHVGAMSSQAFVNPELRPLAINFLANGHPAASALELVMQGDPLRDFRQVGIIDREGRTAVFTGASTRPYSGHRLGTDYGVFGNVLAGEDVLLAMASAFERSTEQRLAERLIRSLEAGRTPADKKARPARCRNARHPFLSTERGMLPNWTCVSICIPMPFRS